MEYRRSGWRRWTVVAAIPVQLRRGALGAGDDRLVVIGVDGRSQTIAEIIVGAGPVRQSAHRSQVAAVMNLIEHLAEYVLDGIALSRGQLRELPVEQAYYDLLAARVG